jgi:hypothetical protein
MVLIGPPFLDSPLITIASPLTFASATTNGSAMQSPDEVKVEITRRKKTITTWAQSQADLFCPLDAEIQVCVTELLGKYPDLTDPESERGIAAA